MPLLSMEAPFWMGGVWPGAPATPMKIGYCVNPAHAVPLVISAYEGGLSKHLFGPFPGVLHQTPDCREVAVSASDTPLVTESAQQFLDRIKATYGFLLT